QSPQQPQVGDFQTSTRIGARASAGRATSRPMPTAPARTPRRVAGTGLGMGFPRKCSDTTRMMPRRPIRSLSHEARCASRRPACQVALPRGGSPSLLFRNAPRGDRRIAAGDAGRKLANRWPRCGHAMKDPPGAALDSEPPFFAPAKFDDPAAALARARLIYDTNVSWLRDRLQRFVAGDSPGRQLHAHYPYVRLRTHSFASAASRLSYGFVAGPGQYETTLTRPDLFGRYYLEQFRLLLRNHGVPLEIGTGRQPIPLHFSVQGAEHHEGTLDAERLRQLRDIFDLPDLAAMDDGIANGTHEPRSGAPLPLALFTAPRVDYSLHRLLHYTGTAPEHFQNFILFTNYQFYLDEFVKLARQMMADDSGAHSYESFVEPGNVVTRRLGAPPNDGDHRGAPHPRPPQKPTHHLVRHHRAGITMVNIGVGPSSARTITDHIAVLRPHAWIMLGHCAGLRTTQQLGDYVLAHGYVREDHVLDEELPLWVPIPALAEVQVALESAVA